jgi:hypothetical protein
MRKRLILLIAVISMLSMTGLAQAAAGELHGTINATYTSKYVWRGFDVFNDKSGIHPGIDLDLYGTGFGFSAVGHMANSSGNDASGTSLQSLERWDYTLYYANRLWESEWYAMNYRLGYVYYNYPDRSSHSTSGDINGTAIDLQELQGVFSFPSLLGVKGLVPSYVLVKLWPSNSGSLVGANSPVGGTASGFAHIFMLDYGWAIPAIVPNTAEQVLNLHGEVIYNDGVGPNGANVDQDWSNAVFGVSTDFAICKDFIFTPGVYHQITMDKSVNDDKDETWAMASLTYKF